MTRARDNAQWLMAQTEGRDFEAKRAEGKSGRGDVPSSFFETYSAFANTEGGIVLLGVHEREDRSLEVVGIADVERVRKALWDSLNNPQKVSVNLLSDEDVEVVDVDSLKILRVRVPRALRQQQPVFIKGNPLTGTYRRRHEGDYRVPEQLVRRMLAEQVDDTRDGRLLEHFDMSDIDAASFKRYRQRHQARNPEHPFNQLDDQEFLRSIGGWARERASGKEGLTAAGALMFGRLVSIKEAFPNYMLDYQERAEPRTEARWVDRVTTDGSWSGNVFDFYSLVIQRLFRDLKVPFRLEGDTRVEETPVHEALRESLVNALIHADYSGRVSLLVVKRPDLFGFRNPGTMRVPIETALAGGVSDCRNRRLQDMFRYVGLGEQAGSGLPKVQAAWRAQSWRAPELVEGVEPVEQTIFTLRMASLLPEDAVQELTSRFGQKFLKAPELKKLALVTALVEGQVTHARLLGMSDAHSRDVTLALASLVRMEQLESRGEHKRTVYVLPGAPPTRPAFAFELAGEDGPAAGLAQSSEHSSSEHSPASSEHSPASSEHSSHRVEQIVQELRANPRLPRERVASMIVALCAGRYRTLPELATLTNRSASTLRVHYLARLVSEGRLAARYPDRPTHPSQAYTASAEAPGSSDEAEP